MKAFVVMQVRGSLSKGDTFKDIYRVYSSKEKALKEIEHDFYERVRYNKEENVPIKQLIEGEKEPTCRILSQEEEEMRKITYRIVYKDNDYECFEITPYEMD